MNSNAKNTEKCSAEFRGCPALKDMSCRDLPSLCLPFTGAVHSKEGSAGACRSHDQQQRDCTKHTESLVGRVVGGFVVVFVYLFLR